MWEESEEVIKKERIRSSMPGIAVSYNVFCNRVFFLIFIPAKDDETWLILLNMLSYFNKKYTYMPGNIYWQKYKYWLF